MWSGPRNISTAMMRSWSSRADTFVVDEPYYAYYLSQNDLDHPGREEVLEEGELDIEKISNGFDYDNFPSSVPHVSELAAATHAKKQG